MDIFADIKNTAIESKAINILACIEKNIFMPSEKRRKF